MSRKNAAISIALTAAMGLAPLATPALSFADDDETGSEESKSSDSGDSGKSSDKEDKGSDAGSSSSDSSSSDKSDKDSGSGSSSEGSSSKESDSADPSATEGSSSSSSSKSGKESGSSSSKEKDANTASDASDEADDDDDDSSDEGSSKSSAVKKVQKKIKAIGKVTLSKADKIEAARKAYNKLSKAQKKQVSNYSTLKKAESKLDDLQAESEEGGVIADGDLSIVNTNRAGQATDIVDVALSEPDGKPKGGQKNKYNGGNGQAWCAYFVVWCARQAGVDASVVPGLYACRDMVSYFQRQHRYYSLDYTPLKGDIIFYAYTKGGVANHVGIVTSVTKDTVTTREGNTSGGKVRTHTYNRHTAGGKVGSSFYIVGYASPGYSNRSSLHQHSDWVETRTPLNEAYHKVNYAECFCGETRTSKQERHTWVWRGSNLVCGGCGADYVASATGEYLAPSQTALYAGESESSAVLATIPAQQVLNVTKVRFKDGVYYGYVTYKGAAGWVALHSLLPNGDAGVHSFEDGVCMTCGVAQVSTEAGVYEVAAEEAVLYNSTNGQEASTLLQGQAVQVVSVAAADDNNYWGTTSQGYLVRMSQLSAQPVDYQISGQGITSLPDGTYVIKAAQDSSLVMSAAEDSIIGPSAVLFGGGKTVSLKSADDSDDQLFELQANENGTYCIVNVATGLALDSDEASKGLLSTISGTGNHVGQSELDAEKWEQQWYLEEQESGAYALRNRATNQYLDSSYAVGGGAVTQEDATAEADQGFYFYPQDDVSSFSSNVMKVSGVTGTYAYTGMKVKPQVSVQVLESSTADGCTYTTLEEGSDYELAFENNKHTGVATVTVTGLGAYSGSASYNFTIAPETPGSVSVKAGATSSFLATWTKSKGATGYEIIYDTNTSMANARRVNLKGSKTVSKRVTGLKKGTYYVAVRAYTKYKGKTVYGTWSTVQKVVVPGKSATASTNTAKASGSTATAASASTAASMKNSSSKKSSAAAASAKKAKTATATAVATTEEGTKLSVQSGAAEGSNASATAEDDSISTSLSSLSLAAGSELSGLESLATQDGLSIEPLMEVYAVPVNEEETDAQ